MKGVLGRISEWAVSNPAPAIAGAVSLVAIVGLVAALRLSPDVGTDKLVDRGSSAHSGTETFRERFGDEAIVVLVRGDLRRLMLNTERISTLLSLEGCLSGRAPGEGELPAAVCGEIRDLGATRVVFGPATFLNQSVGQFQRLAFQQIQQAQQQAQRVALQAQQRAARDELSPEEAQRAAQRAYQEVISEFEAEYAGLIEEIEEIGQPSLDNKRFVRSVVFDENQPRGTPKARFGYLFPSSEAALISIRLEPDLSNDARREAIDLIRTALGDPAFQLEDAGYELAGVPVVLEGLADELGREILLLLGIAIGVMALTLLVAFDPPLRLLPLAVAVGAAALAFGLLAAIGGTLTMASVAVLPVVIGLGVDYAIQLQARFREAAERGERPAAAAVIAAVRGGPMIATAALATGAGFLALVLSPLPMVREFALALAIGIFAALAISLTAGLAALSMVSRPPAARGPTGPSNRDRPRRLGLERIGRLGGLVAVPVRPIVRAAAAAGRRARRAGTRVARRALAISIGAPRVVLVLATLLAAVGWGVGTRTEVVSDVRDLVPATLPALQAVDAVEAETGFSGEINVMVTGERVTSPEAFTWMRDFRQRVLAQHGFEAEPPGCRAEGTELCPGPALTDLYTGAGEPSRRRIDGILGNVPEYFLQAILSEPTDGVPVATSSFLIPVMPLDEQEALIEEVRAELDPPRGIEAEVVGLPVLVADANQSLSDSRYWLTLIAMLAVALVLLAIYRSPTRVLVPLIPIALATGWSALVLEAMGVPLNPMSVTLGVLVIAIATEFSVILSARYGEERAAGRTVGEALRQTYSRTGRAVLVSGVTSIAGFGVLVASGITMLREFGLVTVVDLGVALAGVLIVLPAALVWAEGGFRPVGALVRPGRALRARLAASRRRQPSAHESAG